MAQTLPRVETATLLYVPAVAAGLGSVLVAVRPAGFVHLAMILLALAVVGFDWVEARVLFARMRETRHNRAVAVALTVGLLAVWVALVTRVPERLPLYFALLASVFVLQAIRDVVVLDLTPVDLLTRGYVNLVAVYLVLGAAAETVAQFELALVAIATLVFAVRKSFRWTGAVLAWIRG